MTTATVELYTPEDKEAFAIFLQSSAKADRARPQEKSGLDIITNQYWKNRSYAPEADLPQEAQDAKVHTVETGNEPATDAPQRERGKPSPGKARRTKEEIAEDEAADQADEQGMTLAEVKEYVETAANISASPEDRQDPENPEPADDAETAAADAADEAAETAETKTGVTLDDVRNVLGIYVKAYGMAAAQVDGPKIIATVLGKTHDDAAPCKVSDLTDDKIEAAIAEIKLAGKENRFKRDVVSA